MLRRASLAAAILIVLSAGTAFAQLPMPSFSLHDDKPAPTPEQIERQKALDNAYHAATKKIPDKKEPADPWGSVRPNPTQSSN